MIVMAGYGIGAGIIQMVQNELNNAHTRSNMRLQAQLNQEAIDRQNEYNSPAAQMQRFKDAGLNPDLIYGQSNEGTQGMVSTDAPAVSGPSPIQAAINARLAESQIKLNESAAARNFSQAGNSDAGAEFLRRRTKSQDIIDQLTEANAGKVRKEMDQVVQAIENMKKQGELLGLDAVRKRMENDNYEAKMKAELDKIASEIGLNQAQAAKFKAEAWSIYQKTPAEIVELMARADKEQSLTAYYKSSVDAMAKVIWESLAYRDGLKLDENGHYVAKNGAALVTSYVDAGADKVSKYVGRVASIFTKFLGNSFEAEENALDRIHESNMQESRFEHDSHENSLNRRLRREEAKSVKEEVTLENSPAGKKRTTKVTRHRKPKG